MENQENQWGSQPSQALINGGDLTYDSCKKWIADFNTLPPHEALETLSPAHLSKVVADESPDVVMMGKQAIDDDSNQAAQLLAEYLGWGQATYANTVTIDGDKATVIREADGGLETVATSLPCVTSVARCQA